MEKKLAAYTLSVYEYVVKENRPVGTRDVMRGANLSSTSVASRHLQKLETLGLIEKNRAGDYVLKEKIGVNNQVWIGKTLLPRLLLYSFFFLGALSAEVGIIILSFINTEIVIGIPFLSLTGLTILSMLLFLIEGLRLRQKAKKHFT